MPDKTEQILTALTERLRAVPKAKVERNVERTPLAQPPGAHLVYRLKHPFFDGTSHVVLDPLELLAHLAALVPSSRVSTICALRVGSSSVTQSVTNVIARSRPLSALSSKSPSRGFSNASKPKESHSPTSSKKSSRRT